jgi:hypothetical protein
MNFPRRNALPAFLVLTCVAGPLTAAPGDRYAIDNAEVFLSINVRKFLDATIVSGDLDKLRQMLKGRHEIQSELDAIGFDPFTDLDTLTVVGAPSQGSNQFLVIAHGRFDFNKLIGWTRKTLAEHSELLTTVEEGSSKFLAFTPPGRAEPVFVGWPDSETIVASPVKGFVARAIEVGSDKAQSSLNQPAADLLKILDDTNVVSFFALAGALKNTPQADIIRHAVGGLGIDQGLHLTVAVTAKNADAARQLENTVTEGVAQAKSTVSLMSHRQKELAPVVSFLGAVKVTREGDTVNIRGDLTQDTLTKPSQDRPSNGPSASPRQPVRRPAPKRPLRGS